MRKRTAATAAMRRRKGEREGDGVSGGDGKGEDNCDAVSGGGGGESWRGGGIMGEP